jgi:hypothetical protein
MEFKFDEDNPNALCIMKDGRIHNMISIPSNDYGCDIINFGDVINEGYTYDFQGLILITTPTSRTLYNKGIVLTQTKR